MLPAITGTAKDGQTLTSSTGTWSGSPTSYARAWQRCDSAGANCAAISGATATTYLVTSADVGKTIRVKVTATNSSGSGNATSAQTAVVVAAAPANTAAPAITGTAKDGQTLTSTTGTWTGTTPITYARQWRRCDTAGTNCTDISGATATTYVLGAGDVGTTIKVVITASNTAGNTSASSAATATVIAAAPVNTVVPAITGTAKEGQLLTSSTGTWTGSATITYTYQWQSCTGSTCTAISGASSSTYRLLGAQVGKTIKVVVTATNGAGNASATSAGTATVTTGAPVNVTTPTVTGTATEGQTLTTANGTWAGTAPITYARQWKRCNSAGASCTNISGATGTAYTLVAADIGSTIRVTWTATNGVGSSGSDTVQTAVIAARPPANSGVPAITGTAKVGQTLTSTTGTWTGTPTITYVRQWQRCDSSGTNCNNIPGASGSTYVLVGADAGAKIVVAVTATNAAGSVIAVSATTALIASNGPVNTAPPTMTGTARQGQVLRAANGTWTSASTISYAFQWRRCDAAGVSCTDVSGATYRFYTATAADVGHTLRVAATATDANGSSTTTSNASDTIVSSLPQHLDDPQITGSARVGKDLSITAGAWGGTPPISFSYVWQRCDSSGNNCVTIVGEHDAQLTLTSGDLGHTVRAAVAGANDFGTQTRTSASSALVGGAQTSEPAVALSGSLVATPNTWLTGSTYQLAIAAAAGVDSSGLDVVKATLDGEQIFRDDDPCTGSNCTFNHTITIDTSAQYDGVHAVAVTVVNEDGRTQTESATFLIDHETPSAPTHLSVYDDDGQPHLSWDSPGDLDIASYDVMRRIGSAGSPVLVATTPQTSVVDVTSPPGIDVEYFVRAHDQAGNLGPDSSTVHYGAAAVLDAPTGLEARLSGDGAVQLRWNPVAGATAYQAFVMRPSATSPEPVGMTDGPKSELSDASASGPGSYVYTVRAMSASGQLGQASDGATVLIAPDDDTPSIVLSGPMVDQAISGTTALSIHADENEIPDAPGIEDLTVAIDGQEVQSWHQTCTAGGCTMERTWTLDSTQLDDGEHDITITAVDAEGRRGEADLSATIDNHPPSAPPYVWLEDNSDNYVAHWSASPSDDITTYNINFTAAGTPLLAATATVDDLRADLGWCYADCALSVSASDEHGQASATASAQHDLGVNGGALPSTPSNVTAHAQPGAVSLNWTGSADAAGYLIFRRDGPPGTEVQLTPVPLTTTSYVDHDARPGTTTYFTVRSVDTAGLASYASAEHQVAVPHAGTAPQIDLSGSLFDNQGQTITGGVHQLDVHASETGQAIVFLQVSIDGIPQQTIDQPCALGTCDMNTTVSFVSDEHADGQHLVEVVAEDGRHEQATSAFSFTLDASAPEDITGLKAMPSTGAVSLAWDAPDETDLDIYRIYRGASAGTLAQIATTDAPAATYDDTSAADGQHYWYAVQAVDLDGKTSPISQPVDVVVGGAAELAVDAGGGAVQPSTNDPYAINLTWQAVTATDLHGYNIYRRTDPQADWDLLTSTPVSAPAFADDSLIPGSPATYVIKTVDQHGHEGPPSSPVTETAKGMRLGAGISSTAVVGDDGFNWPMITGNDTLLPSAYTSTLSCGAPAPSGICGADFAALERMHLSPDGRKMLMIYRRAGATDVLALRDLQTGAEQVLCSAGPTANGVPACRSGTVHPENSIIEDAAFSPDGQNILVLQPIDQAPPAPAVAPLGVWKVSVSGGTGQLLFSSSIADDTYSLNHAPHLAIAADGSVTIFREDQPTPVGQLPNCDGTRYTQTGVVIAQVHVPVSSPDENCLYANVTTNGEHLLFIDYSDGYPRAAIADLDGSDVEAVSPSGVAVARSLNVSPDGARVLYYGVQTGLDEDGRATESMTVGDWESMSTQTGGGNLYVTDIATHQTRTQPVDTTYFDPTDPGSTTFQWLVATPNYAQTTATLDVSSNAPATLLARGDQTVHLQASASATQASIDEIAAFVAGHRTDPTSVTAGQATLDVDASAVAEGRHALWIAAGDTAGQERSIKRTLVVDNTAPDVSDELTRSDADDNGDVQINWPAPTDPELADGTPGSGVTTTSYRYMNASGTWSAWQAASDNGFSVAADQLGDSIDIRALDVAGNQSIRRAATPDAIQPTPFGCAANARPTGKLVGPDYPTWKAASGRFTFKFKVKCGHLVAAASGELCLFTGTLKAPDKLGCKQMKIASGAIAAGGLPVTMTWTCRRPYVGNVKVYPLMTGVGWQEGSESPGPLIPAAHIRGVILSCPTERAQQAAESDAWRHLTKTPFKCRGTVAQLAHTCWKAEHLSPPEAFLRTELKRDAKPDGPPSYPVAGWDAHHVIPARGGSPESILPQSIGFRCEIHPNSKTNGIYLRRRSGPLGDTSAWYTQLVDDGSSLAGRVAHWNYDEKPAAEQPGLPKHAHPYSFAIADYLRPALNTNGTCKSPSSGSRFVRTITKRLANNFIPGLGTSPSP